jgi:Condensation domain
MIGTPAPGFGRGLALLAFRTFRQTGYSGYAPVIMNDQIVVPFAGGDSGTADLTWGQWDIWPKMRLHNFSFSVGSWLPLPAGATAADVAADLRFLICRYPALRTRLAFTPDGRPHQVVAAAGEVVMEIVEAGDGDPEQVAADLYHRYDAHVFDESREWPLKWAAVVSGGVATHVVWVISHLVADGPSMVTMLQDLAAEHRVTSHAIARHGITARDEALGPVTALQPLELARWQASAAGQRKSKTTLRQWERLLRSIPARRFAGSADPREPVYWRVLYDSPAAHLASRLLAARTGTSTGTVLLAAFAITLSKITGITPAVLQVVMNNRFRRDMAGTVSPLALPAPVVIDATDASFEEVVRRAWQRSIGTYRLSYYDPRARDELVAAVSKERGEHVDIDCFVNDRRALMDEPTGDLPEPAAVRAALDRSELTWGWQSATPGNNLFLHINGVPDTVNYELCANTRHISPASLEAFLRGMESVLVEAVP